MPRLPVAVVVIPTFNEAGHTARMIDFLFTKTFPGIHNWRCVLLYVDGKSPDGTWKIIQEKQKEYKNLDLLIETKKEGIGAAYVKGFRRAMEKHQADVIIEFDSDFQHPPKDIPILLKEISAGYDYVLGSRKIQGGSNPKGWGLDRIFWSEVGGFSARTIMFFPTKYFFQVTDPTTGLKASRVKGFVDTMDMDHLYSRSFGYKLEFLYKMVKLGAKIKEIPLQFGLRATGESKIEPQTAKDILKSAVLLRWNDPTTQKFIKFGTVGFIGYLVNAIGLAIFFGLTHIEWLAWLLSTELAIISNFTWNNFWTFKSDKIFGIGMLSKKFIQFNFTSLGALLIQTVAGTLLVYLTHFNRQLLLPFIIAFLILPYNWLMYNTFIWKKK